MDDKRADDLNEDSSLPQPGTEEPDDPESSDSTQGPGNVSVDEPTQPIMNPTDDRFGEDDD
ncbi:MAG: hypothetical protein ACRDK3_15155 [Actinomycetota bacterium]